MTETLDPISILQLSDLHMMETPEATLLGVNTEYYFRACLEQAVRLGPRQIVRPSSRQAVTAKNQFDLILLTGDLAQDPCLASYRSILAILDQYQIPSLCLPGNHDDYDLMLHVLNTDSIHCHKKLLLGNWQLISLNSQIPEQGGGRLPGEELAFLENSLTENPNRHALIAVHHHCLETNSPWMDAIMIENRQEFLAILDKYPQVKAVTHGHIHQVMDRQTATYRVLGAPSTCFQFTPESPELSIDDTAPGYRIIELYADGLIESEVFRLPEPLVGLQASVHNY